MLHEIVSDFIVKGNTIITGPTGNGITSLTLHLMNCLLKDDINILYYNSTQEIQKDFVKKFYPRVYSDVLFYQGDLYTLTNYLEFINYDIDYLIIDPGDSIMVNKKLIPLLVSIFHEKKKLIVTSQIRQDPTQGGQVYSPIEKLNNTYNGTLFKYSLWIRDVTQETNIFKERYVDIFDKIRVGNKYIRRYIAKFNEREGNIVS
jgi:hypothetical protein